MNMYFAVLLGYSALLILVGQIAAKRVHSASDFLVGGRRFGAGVIFATFLAANIGAGSTVGASGLGFRIGLSAWWWVGSAGIGTLILSQSVGPRLWRIAKDHDLHTLGDYLEFRYSKTVRGVISALLWFGTLAILAGQIMAISWILSVVIGLPKWAGCVAGGLVAVSYCATGGIAASAIVNIFELAVTMTGLTVSALYALHLMGGWTRLTAALASSSPAWAARMTTFTGAGPRPILALLAILVPSFICSPGLVQKIYSARDERSVRVGVALNSLGQLLFAFVPALFGMIALVHFGALTNSELALPAVLARMVPPWLGVWALAAIFSAELSATDAILFMLSTSLAVDLYKTFLRPAVTQKELLSVSRATTVGAGLAGVGLAIVLPSVITAVTIFYGLLAVGLFVPLVLGLYWKRMSVSAALASIFVAIGADLAVQFGTVAHSLGLASPPAVGIFAGLATAIAVSAMFPESRSAEIEELAGEERR
jgi:solute:Na+ symporter, SSS family